MAFDFDEARATIEEAKKRGLIRASDSVDSVSPESSSEAKSKLGTSGAELPDWLQKEIK